MHIHTCAYIFMTMSSTNCGCIFSFSRAKRWKTRFQKHQAKSVKDKIGNYIKRMKRGYTPVINVIKCLENKVRWRDISTSIQVSNWVGFFLFLLLLAEVKADDSNG